jgi:catechol 2,3-dioxygenase-like lactoylglutathione lyase family enzyme
MLNIGAVVLGVDDVRRAVEFWSRALNYEPQVTRDGWAELGPAGGGPGALLALQLSETPAREKPRMHLDLFAADAADQAAEVERLMALGATEADWDDYPADADFVVLADPEGNRFCVIDTTHG